MVSCPQGFGTCVIDTGPDIGQRVAGREQRAVLTTIHGKRTAVDSPRSAATLCPLPLGILPASDRLDDPRTEIPAQACGDRRPVHALRPGGLRQAARAEGYRTRSGYQ